MNKHTQMRLWKHVWKRPGMYVGEPSVHRLTIFWHGFASGQDPAENSATLYRDFEQYVQKKTRLSFAAVGMNAVQYKFDKQFGRGKLAVRKAVAYLAELAHAYGAKRFGPTTYAECDPAN